MKLLPCTDEAILSTTSTRLLCILLLLWSCAPARGASIGHVAGAPPSREPVALPYSRAEDVAPPCPPPAIDTTGWKRVHAVSAPISFLLPKGWVAAPCREHDPSVELWCESLNGNEVTLQVGVGAPSPPTANSGFHPTLNFSRCELQIDGQAVWIWTGIPTGYSHVARAAASWRLTDSTFAYLAGEAERRNVHEQMVAMLRTVRVKR